MYNIHTSSHLYIYIKYNIMHLCECPRPQEGGSLGLQRLRIARGLRGHAAHRRLGDGHRRGHQARHVAVAAQEAHLVLAREPFKRWVKIEDDDKVE